MPSSPKSAGKQERLAAALRENLKRRKAKAKELGAQDAATRGPAMGDDPAPDKSAEPQG